MKYPCILFDLDGTLTRSEEGIIRSVEYALEKMELCSPGFEALKCFIGPPLTQSFTEYCHLSHEDAIKAAELYRQRYTHTGLFECELYPGLQELLQNITENGGKVYLATAKPLEFAQRILAHFAILPLFSGLYGPPLDCHSYNKADIIARLLAENEIPPSAAVMVGDRSYDIVAACHCGVDSIGVLYGYGTQEELCSAGATYLAKDASQLAALLL